MGNISNFKSLKKEEMITEYEKLLEKYEELENDYDAAMESRAELYFENGDLKDELKDIKEETKHLNNQREKKIKDIKFGTDLQGCIIETVLNFVEETRN